MSNRTQNQPKGAANQSQGQQVISDVQARTIDEIRNQGMDPETLQKIQHDKAEMDRIEKENSEWIRGNYISFKEDQEIKTLLFTGKYQKVDVPAKDFATGKLIENKFVQKWRFECYDVTDQTNLAPEVLIWERGWREAKVVMHFLGEQKAELVVVRNGARGNSQTTYLIYPANAPIASQPSKLQEKQNYEGQEEPNEQEQDEAIANTAQLDRDGIGE